MDLLRFQHCGSTVFTAADAAPGGLRCPVCGGAVRGRLAEAPVRIRSPIKDGHRAPCCFLVTSQLGAAGLSEHLPSELHVGVSSSEGEVFSYTEWGVQRQQQGWEQSIIIPLVAPDNHILSFTSDWDRQLEAFAGLDCWTPDRFQEQRAFGSCCYGFALGFINHLMMSQDNQPISPECFTAQYVLPRMETASRYLSVHRHVCRHGYYSTDQPSPLYTHTHTIDTPPPERSSQKHKVDVKK